MESLSDIVAQMRGRGEDGRMDRRLWLDYADRIEAAWKREKAEIEANALAVGGVVEAARHKPVGNAAALRQAVVKALTLIHVCTWPPEVSLDGVAEVVHEIDSVLDKPPRNCYVGTPDEQAERFGKLCGKYYNEEETCNEKCPLASLPIIHGFPRCQAYWAQMPYTDEGAEK